MDGREARGGEDPIDLATAVHVELVVPPEEAAQPVEGQCRSADVPSVAGMDEPDEPQLHPLRGIDVEFLDIGQDLDDVSFNSAFWMAGSRLTPATPAFQRGSATMRLSMSVSGSTMSQKVSCAQTLAL